jgi:hypothetical protein
VRHQLFKRGILDAWPGFVIAVATAEQTLRRQANRATFVSAWTTPVHASAHRATMNL